MFSSSLKSYWEKRRDGSLTLATIRDDTWNVLNMQHITPNSKTWDYSDTPGSGNKKIKVPKPLGDFRDVISESQVTFIISHLTSAIRFQIQGDSSH